MVLFLKLKRHFLKRPSFGIKKKPLRFYVIAIRSDKAVTARGTPRPNVSKYVRRLSNGFFYALSLLFG